MRRGISLALALVSIAAGGARLAHSQEEGSGHASIDFVSLGGIDDWRAQGNEALLIKASNGNWYRAEFAAPCPGIRFRDAIGFVTDGTDRLDKFSSVLVHGERCWFRSFEKIDPSALPGEDPSTRERE